MNTANKHLLDKIIAIVKMASKTIMEVYINAHEAMIKSDGTPVTEADLASHHLIKTELKQLTPDIKLISEESVEEDMQHWNHDERFWLVDPLDGTKEFINRNGEFTINVALIERGNPVLGVVCAPALNLLYAASETTGAFKCTSINEKKSMSVNLDTREGFIVVGSRSHGNPESMQEFLTPYRVSQFISVGSSLKFCKIAEGSAHLYPRFGRTMEWDTAAGHAVLIAAGGDVLQLDGTPLRYGKKGFENPHFIAKPRALLLQ